MKILAIDMGTGTQDILLFDSSGPIENSIKFVMPSATKIAEGRIRHATASAVAVLLTGVTQGGGPCHWALEDHLRAGHKAYATPEAARTFDDDLDQVAAMGIIVVSEDEATRLAPRIAARTDSTRTDSTRTDSTRTDRSKDLSSAAHDSGTAHHIVLQDLDLPAIRTALAAFDVSPHFDGLALACLDHGAAPPGYSDRLFRFDHLKRVVEQRNDLRAFAMLPDDIPDYLTRARIMIATARAQDADDNTPIVFLDTGPAAALGALQDSRVSDARVQLVLNLGNMHALAFHLIGPQIISLYEHHTGEMTPEQIDDFTRRLITGDLAHEEVFSSKGHGVFYADNSKQPTADSRPTPDIIAVTGPQRSKIHASSRRASSLNPYFATPHGDMMISGCFGLLVAFAEKYPEHSVEIAASLVAST